jgi:YD repeat-containing protein
MDQTDAGEDADSTTTREAFPFDLPEPPNIDAGDWMSPGASKECTPRPEAEGRCYDRYVPRLLDRNFQGVQAVCRIVQYQRTDKVRINSFRQFRIDRNECGEPVRVLRPSWTYGFTYDAQGQLDARVVPEMPADVQWRYVFDDKERLTQLEVVGPDTNLESTSFEYDALGNRTKMSFQSGDTLKSYDSECRITQLDGSRMDSGPTTWMYQEVDDGLVVIKRSEFRNDVEAGSRFTKTKRIVEDGRLVKTVSWRQQGPPSRETPIEDDWTKVGKSFFYYDAEGRRIARVEYRDPASAPPPATPQWVNRYYYDCAWAK